MADKPRSFKFSSDLNENEYSCMLIIKEDEEVKNYVTAVLKEDVIDDRKRIISIHKEVNGYKTEVEFSVWEGMDMLVKEEILKYLFKWSTVTGFQMSDLIQEKIELDIEFSSSLPFSVFFESLKSKLMTMFGISKDRADEMDDEALNEYIKSDKYEQKQMQKSTQEKESCVLQ